MINPQEVETIFKDCLFREDEMGKDGKPKGIKMIEAEGIKSTFGFHPDRGGEASGENHRIPEGNARRVLQGRRLVISQFLQHKGWEAVDGTSCDNGTAGLFGDGYRQGQLLPAERNVVHSSWRDAVCTDKSVEK